MEDRSNRYRYSSNKQEIRQVCTKIIMSRTSALDREQNEARIKMKQSHSKMFDVKFKQLDWVSILLKY